MPLGQYPNFAACVRRNRDKRSPRAYCGRIYWNTEGKNGLKRFKDRYLK